jgi:hypothetical protein
VPSATRPLLRPRKFHHTWNSTAVSAEYYRKVRMIAKTTEQKLILNILGCLRITKIRSTNFVRAK